MKHSSFGTKSSIPTRLNYIVEDIHSCHGMLGTIL